MRVDSKFRTTIHTNDIVMNIEDIRGFLVQSYGHGLWSGQEIENINESVLHLGDSDIMSSQ